MAKPVIESLYKRLDHPQEAAMRPATMEEFTGQERIRSQLDVLMSAALQRQDVPGHCLFSGPPGLGKTTLASIVATFMNVRFIPIAAPVIERPADLALELTKLQKGDVLFIDEIHRLPKVVEEYLYTAMEDFVIDIPKSTRLPLQKFTLIGATTRLGMLSSPFRSRFQFTARLEYYTIDELVEILRRSSMLLDFELVSEAFFEIAKRSRGTPRVANRLLKWVRDYVAIRHNGNVSLKAIEEALESLQIDSSGLDEMDRKILEAIVVTFDGGPVGLQTLSHAVNEEAGTIEEVHEPYLLSRGLLKKTPRGREATVSGQNHIRSRMKNF